jgi:tRNA U54 and U55 pseudouridine synthase Pus10
VARFQASLIDVASATEIRKAEGQVRGRAGAYLKELLGTASGRTVARLRADGLL